MRTLLLDTTFRPVEVIGWKRAIILMITGRAEILECYHDIDIRSPSECFKLPKTLRLFNIHRSSRTVKFNRFNRFSNTLISRLFNTVIIVSLKFLFLAKAAWYLFNPVIKQIALMVKS